MTAALDPGRAFLAALLGCSAPRVVELVEHVDADDVADPVAATLLGIVRDLAAAGRDPAPAVVLAEARRLAVASGARVRSVLLDRRDDGQAEADGDRRAASEADRVAGALAGMLVELTSDATPPGVADYLAAAVVRDARRRRLVEAAQALDRAARDTPDDLIDEVVTREAEALAAMGKRLALVEGVQ